MCFKPEGRWHLFLEAFPERLRPCPGVHIHTALFLAWVFLSVELSLSFLSPQLLQLSKQGPCQREAPLFLFPFPWG